MKVSKLFVAMLAIPGLMTLTACQERGGEQETAGEGQQGVLEEEQQAEMGQQGEMARKQEEQRGEMARQQEEAQLTINKDEFVNQTEQELERVRGDLNSIEQRIAGMPQEDRQSLQKEVEQHRQHADRVDQMLTSVQEAKPTQFDKKANEIRDELTSLQEDVQDLESEVRSRSQQQPSA